MFDRLFQWSRSIQYQFLKNDAEVDNDNNEKVTVSSDAVDNLLKEAQVLYHFANKISQSLETIDLLSFSEKPISISFQSLKDALVNNKLIFWGDPIFKIPQIRPFAYRLISTLKSDQESLNLSHMPHQSVGLVGLLLIRQLQFIKQIIRRFPHQSFILPFPRALYKTHESWQLILEVLSSAHFPLHQLIFSLDLDGDVLSGFDSLKRLRQRGLRIMLEETQINFQKENDFLNCDLISIPLSHIVDFPFAQFRNKRIVVTDVSDEQKIPFQLIKYIDYAHGPTYSGYIPFFE